MPVWAESDCATWCIEVDMCGIWSVKAKRCKGRLLLRLLFMLNWMLKSKLNVKATGNSYLWAQRSKIKCLLEHELRTSIGIKTEDLNTPKPWRFGFSKWMSLALGVAQRLFAFCYFLNSFMNISVVVHLLAWFFFLFTKSLISRLTTICQTIWYEMSYLLSVCML